MKIRIESYEPYHIGIKLEQHVNLDFFKKKIKDILKGKEYNIIEDSIIESLIKEVVGIKNNVKVELNRATQALNIIGENPTNVTEIFDEITANIPEGYDIDSIMSFYEIITNMNIMLDTNPTDLLTKSSNIDLSSLKDIDNMIISSIMISNSTKEKYNIFKLIIEPNPVSPSNSFYIKLLYRSREKQKVIFFQNILEDRITRLIKSIG